MPLFLSLLGIVITVAGLGVIAGGWREGTLDAQLLTPGTIATVGGLLLVGVALTIRELRQIGRALSARVMPRLTQPDVAEGATLTPDAEVRLPLPPKAALKPAPSAGSSSPIERTETGRQRTKIGTPAQAAGNARAEEADTVPAPRVPARAEEDVLELNDAAARPVPAVAPLRAPSRPSGKAATAPAAVTAGGSGLSGLWPRRSARNGQTPAPAAAVPETEEQPEAIPAADAASAVRVPVSVLKSGNVEGMAYTLYSDGSIEAQLPDGVVRFGSISALRQHLEGIA